MSTERPFEGLPCKGALKAGLKRTEKAEPVNGKIFAALFSESAALFFVQTLRGKIHRKVL